MPACLARSASARKVPRVGYLSPVSAAALGYVIFRQSLRELGYVEGEDVIVASSPPAIRGARHATTTIPVVMITADDPVRSGYVESLARPGGNVTGVTFLAVDLFAKQMELLKQIAPKLTGMAVLWDPTMPTATHDLDDVRAAAPRARPAAPGRRGARVGRLRRRIRGNSSRARACSCRRG
jgi:hypothetical protein